MADTQFMYALTIDSLVTDVQNVVNTLSDKIGIPSTTTWLMIAAVLFVGIVVWAYRT